MIDELNDVDNHINVECLYCDIQPLFTNSIVHLNVRSLVHKVNELESDVQCRKTLDDSDVVDVKLYECTRTLYIESADDNREDIMT